MTFRKVIGCCFITRLVRSLLWLEPLWFPDRGMLTVMLSTSEANTMMRKVILRIPAGTWWMSSWRRKFDSPVTLASLARESEPRRHGVASKRQSPECAAGEEKRIRYRPENGKVTLDATLHVKANRVRSADGKLLDAGVAFKTMASKTLFFATLSLWLCSAMHHVC